MTRIAPSSWWGLRASTVEMCSSDVPGGVSTIRKSRSPQATSVTNCLIKAMEIKEADKKTPNHNGFQQVAWEPQDRAPGRGDKAGCQHNM